MRPKIWSALQTYPDMCKCGTQRLLAVYPESLCDNRNDGHKNTHKTVLKNADPDNLYDNQHL